MKRRDQWVEAEELLRRAVAMGRELPRSERLAEALDHLASHVARNGRLSEAEEMRREALARVREREGEENLDVAACLNNLAMVLGRQGKMAEGEAMCRQALAIYIKLLDKTHERVGSTLDNLGGMLISQGRRAEAEPLWRDMLENYRARLPADSDEVLSRASDFARLLVMVVGKDKSDLDSVAAAAKAREAVQLLRDCVARWSQPSRPPTRHLTNAKGRLAAALIVLAARDSALTTSNRVALLAEAEPLLTAVYERVLAKADDQAQRVQITSLVGLYETWETLSPNTGKASLALEWRRKLALLPPPDTNGPPRDLFR